jgi:phosphatidylserine/phosphatidylglycerophosphate/cardiolipin synthase-like enzyme
MSKKWFLDRPVQPGTSEDWRRAETSDTTVTYHLNRKSYYGRLAELVPQMQRGSTLFLAGWGVTLDQRLDDPFKTTKKDDPGWEKTLRGVLWEAMENGVKIRFLATQNLKYRPANKAMVDEVNAMASGSKGPVDVAACFDTQVPNKYATHHQKTVYLSAVGDQGPFMFIGGMDVMDMGKDWIDAQAEVVGKGAALGYLSLQERWESAYSRREVKLSWAPPPSKGTTSVQIVRSYGTQDNTGRKYHEDNTYGHLILNAIKNTSKFIYIEDQFFWYTPLITAALRDFVNAGKTLVVITNVGLEKDEETQKPVNWTAENADMIRNHTSAKQRVHFLCTPWRFTHTKAWVFDDEMALVGSANYWDRSLLSDDQKKRTIESEIGVAVVGDPAKSLRLSLWKRLLADARSAIQFPDASLDFFGELAVLMGLKRDEVVTPSGGLKAPRAPSPFKLIPPPLP